jgi:antagonist of KipI
MTLVVQKAALMMTIQDRGRMGYQRYGLPESGPVDAWAHQAANRLVGNDPGAACVEMGLTEAAFMVGGDTLLSACGAGYCLFVNGRELPLWMSFRARRGDQVDFRKCPGGNWCYLAVGGGILSSQWIGSRSVYLRAGLGRLLTVGDRLPTGIMAESAVIRAGRQISPTSRPPYGARVDLDVIPGPHTDRFYAKSIEAFWTGEYRLSGRFDRMGYRLSGPQVDHRNGADIISQGMAAGTIQIPADGQPIVMMPDHPTTGGYTCMGTLAPASLPLLAQAEPGSTEIRFQPVTADSARKTYREVHELIESDLEDQEEIWSRL